MNDQLFWIISIFLLVELMSQVFQFEILGKIYMQFYTIVIHALIGISLASFETRELVYYFLILIAFVNSFRYFTYKIPIMQKNRPFRFGFDVLVIMVLVGLLTFINDYIQFDEVPSLSQVSQFSFLGALSLVLIYEMIQRASETGLHLNSFFPRTFISFILVVSGIIVGLYLALAPFIGVSFAVSAQILAAFSVASVMIRMLSLRLSKDSEFYDLFYVMPSLFVVIVFLQLVLIGV